ncbi:MAG: TetR/AcrR family transcriptional regulator C-terminal domain-containing protein [Rectinemataceae bacterium]
MRLGDYPELAMYYYFPNKAALFDGIVEKVYLEIDPGPMGESGDPRERVAEAVRSMRRAFLRHSRALPIVSTRLATTPAVVKLIEAFLSLLEDAGFSPEVASDAITCFAVFTIGHTLAQAREPLGGEDPNANELFQASADCPHFNKALKTMKPYDPDRQLELGLKALIDGFWGGLKN